MGSNVTISGSALTTATSVQFNGVEATFKVFADQLIATVPSAASSGPITVTTPDGAVVTDQSFIVTDGGDQELPVISSFSPAAGSAGSRVTINGSNLASADTVAFNGVNAPFIVFGTQVIATVPSGATTGPITVVTPKGEATSADSFTVETASTDPVISGFEPLSGPAGTTVQIRGENLTDVASVRFNGVDADFSVFGRQINAVVPAGATKGPITVVTAFGETTSDQIFSVTSPARLEIAGFSPMSGLAGTNVVIQGTRLDAVTEVHFNGLRASFSSFGEQIIATVPTNATTGPITASTADATTATEEDFTVLLPPAITEFAPTNGLPGTLVTVSGINLRSVSSVLFNETEADFELSGNDVIATVPEGAASGPITVFNDVGSDRSEDFVVGIDADLGIRFSTVQPVGVNEPVSIVAIPSNAGPLAAFQTEVTITVPNSATVVSASSSGGSCSIDGQRVTCTLDELSPQTVGAIFLDLAIEEPGETTLTADIAGAIGDPHTENNSAELTVIALVSAEAPLITDFSPKTGAAGTTILISGANFEGAVSVELNNVAAEFTVVSATAISATVPADASSGPIRVSTPEGIAVSDEQFEIEIAESEPPELTVEWTTDNEIRIQWPLSDDFTLQSAGSFSGSVSWEPVESPAVVIDGTSVVTVPITETARFFRLAR